MSDGNAYTICGNDTSGVGEADEAAVEQEVDSQSRLKGLCQTGSSSGNGKRTWSGVKPSPKSSNSDDTDACSSSHNGKDSAMETTESKSSNSHSPSPPNSSMAYSLLSGSSEQDNPSTSGCSSDQPARLQTQRELLKALKELKIRMPADQRSKGRSSTLASLQYALNCVKQVRANQEYYHQWSVEESHGCSLDLSAFTTEELDNITSEYTLQNTDTFSVGVSFLSGKVVYISPQASPMLRTKPERLQGALFSELLAPQDVSTFYSSTAPCRLPPWSSCTGSSLNSPVDCTQEKSMFCRISGGRDSEGEVRYYPFRMTPYQLTLGDSEEFQPCCLLIAERVHSGYEAPRIPADKRIFTTSHTPSCVFQEVDERAVPLLGYLPQDLVGTPVLMYLHPDDRPVMVAIHKKILQSAGQPFEHSPLRMCARNGEYLTIDTSWSSFVNPWSRKVAFIVGRHKVRTSPLNEDVFTPSVEVEARAMSPEVPRLSEQIHRVLVQPVHRGGSQGYCSSHGFHRQRPGPGSSSGSNSPTAKDITLMTTQRSQMTFQQMCKDVHMVKTNGQQVFIESRNRPPLRRHGALVGQNNLNKGPTRALGPIKTLASVHSRKEPSASYSYQQINCLDSIVRYLESCNVPNTVKRKCGSSSCTTSSTSDDDKQRELPGTAKELEGPRGNDASKGGPHMSPLALHCKAESVVSVTSQCSFSSTIVHVGDKKPPESDIVMMEENPTTSTPTSPATPNTVTTAVTPQPTVLTNAATRSHAQPEKDDRRSAGCSGRLGLTKEVLSAHTQQEEQVFLSRFQDLGELCMLDPGSPSQRGHTATPKGVRSSQDYPAGANGRRRGRGGKRLKHHQEGSQHGQSGSGVNSRSRRERHQGLTLPTGQPLMMQGPQTSSSSWPTSVASQASLPPAVPQYPPGVLPFFPLYPQQLLGHTGVNPNMQLGYPSPQPGFQFPLHSSQIPMAMAPPMMVVLPNFMFPQLNGGVPQLGQLNAALPTAYNTAIPHLSPPMPGMTQLNPAIPLAHLNPGLAQFSPAMAPMNGVPQLNPALTQLGQSQLNPALSIIPQRFYNPCPTLPFPNPAPVPGLHGAALPGMDPTFVRRSHSRSSTPQSTGQAPLEGTDSPLFQSRCSSPLNLLQLEELPGSRPEAASAGPRQTPPPPGSASQVGGQGSVNCCGMKEDAKEDYNADADDQDAMSTSSELLDLLLQEDACSGTGSAASGSGSSGSGSNGCSTSGSGTRSSNTSKYFGSIDSSENDHSHKQTAGGAEEAQLLKYVLQDPIWLLMANTDDKVMMTYQMPTRDRETVLREDRMVLRAVQKKQPHFTEEQKRELIQVHPWMGTGRLPQAIHCPTCTGCGSPPTASAPRTFEVDLQDMTEVLQLQEEGGASPERPVTMATDTGNTAVAATQGPQTDA
ncbi:period circadian protein homolog 1 isoform X2 [Esox lucius]|uniref:period circadian protein homolog 1 isoform X2 n=1 Tax=Esox lucius TaxID=8010 RepID=UPI0014775119|nr:period circadian protein homolog 1 isoform X2 [Esox lucius]